MFNNNYSKKNIEIQLYIYIFNICFSRYLMIDKMFLVIK